MHWCTIRGIYPVSIEATGLAKARQVFAEHQGMLRTSEAIRLVRSPLALYTPATAAISDDIGQGALRLYRLE